MTCISYINKTSSNKISTIMTYINILLTFNINKYIIIIFDTICVILLNKIGSLYIPV